MFKWERWLKSFVMESEGLLVPYSQCHDCWCPFDARSLFCAKPFYELMLNHCQMDSRGQTSAKSELDRQQLSYKKMSWKISSAKRQTFSRAQCVKNSYLMWISLWYTRAEDVYWLFSYHAMSENSLLVTKDCRRAYLPGDHNYRYFYVGALSCHGIATHLKIGHR